MRLDRFGQRVEMITPFEAADESPVRVRLGYLADRAVNTAKSSVSRPKEPIGSRGAHRSRR